MQVILCSLSHELLKVRDRIIFCYITKCHLEYIHDNETQYYYSLFSPIIYMFLGLNVMDYIALFPCTPAMCAF